MLVSIRPSVILFPGMNLVMKVSKMRKHTYEKTRVQKNGPLSFVCYNEDCDYVRKPESKKKKSEK